MTDSPIPRRPYGNTGVELSVIGFGGIVVKDATPEHASEVVAEAIERGINYFDVAPSYGDAEIKLGPALEPYREDCFLACKTTNRDRRSAAEDFERSLERLRTDHFDLYQLHSITDVESDVDAAFADDGVMPYLLEQKAAGRIRFLGFSAHSEAAALAAMDRYDFDSILLPINFASWMAGEFGPRVLERVKAKGMAILALKALARQRWASPEVRESKGFKKCWYEPIDDHELASLALRFTLAQGVTAAIPPGEESLWRMAAELATEDLSPPTEQELEALRSVAAGLEPVFPLS